jgi:hypothetical protein
MKKNDVFKNKLGGAVDKSAEAYIKQHIGILPELEALIPPLSAEEHALLQASIAQEGCRESLLLWRQDDTRYILIDGHNRHSICRALGIDFNIKVQENLPNLDAVKDWMILNQLGKRNVTEETKSYLRGLQYRREKQTHGGDRKTSGQDDHLKTNERLAEQHKVSAKTIQRDEIFAMALDTLVGDSTDLKWKILNKEIPIPKSKIEKLAKEDPEQLKTLCENLGSLQDFKKAIDATFPQTDKQALMLPEEMRIMEKLQKAVQEKDRQSVMDLLQYLQEKMKNW